MVRIGGYYDTLRTSQRAKSLSKEQQKDFERAIRVLWANGKINDKEYYDAINEALKSIKTHSEGF